MLSKQSLSGDKSPEMNANHLDLDALAELEDIMEEDFGILIETYLVDGDKKLAAISAALSDENSNLVRELAHSFKGASCNVGALPLSRLCEDVEQFAKNGDINEIPARMPAILDEYQAVKQLLEEKIS